jgi:hypothetical protein
MILIGIDPGLIDTGFTKLIITDKTWLVRRGVCNDIPQLADLCKDADTVFVEDFRTRLVAVGSEMVHKQREIIKAINAPVKAISNSGVTKIITEEMMKALDLWDENIKTHHKDIRSSSRILLYGMAQDKTHGYNQHLSERLKEYV